MPDLFLPEFVFLLRTLSVKKWLSQGAMFMSYDFSDGPSLGLQIGVVFFSGLQVSVVFHIGKQSFHIAVLRWGRKLHMFDRLFSLRPLFFFFFTQHWGMESLESLALALYYSARLNSVVSELRSLDSLGLDPWGVKTKNKNA